jgi:hypothetical protein
MNKEQLFFAFFAFLCGGALLFSGAKEENEMWNPLGIKGGWIARAVSRTLTEHADDAYHGGARHDIRFSPKTRLGQLMGGIVDQRGEGGREGRQRADDAAQRTYSEQVKAWLRFSRDIDPSNFNAFFVYYTWLSEGMNKVEVGEEEDDGDEFGGIVEEVTKSTGTSLENRSEAGHDDGGYLAKNNNGEAIVSAENLDEVLEASKIYLKNTTLANSLECHNATIGIWMEYEARIKANPSQKTRSEIINTLIKMRAISALGDYLGEGRAHLEDVAQSRQYARALIKNIDSFINSEQ